MIITSNIKVFRKINATRKSIFKKKVVCMFEKKEYISPKFIFMVKNLIFNH